mmetsp:Transcript_33785/g.107955  ORF Transcript_33785/g.107955 Transcript_33785/m.107955 type:complete len:292 (-) Transcript_33785:50-925(-)
MDLSATVSAFLWVRSRLLRKSSAPSVSMKTAFGMGFPLRLRRSSWGDLRRDGGMARIRLNSTERWRSFGARVGKFAGTSVKAFESRISSVRTGLSVRSNDERPQPERSTNLRDLLSDGKPSSGFSFKVSDSKRPRHRKVASLFSLASRVTQSTSKASSLFLPTFNVFRLGYGEQSISDRLFCERSKTLSFAPSSATLDGISFSLCSVKDRIPVFAACSTFAFKTFVPCLFFGCDGVCPIVAFFCVGANALSSLFFRGGGSRPPFFVLCRALDASDPTFIFQAIRAASHQVG